MPPPHQGRFWRRARVIFRRFRITVLLSLLALLCAFLWLNRVGLPGFLKRPVLDQLRARGLDLEFTRLRLRWYRGLVAENVRLVQTAEAEGPRFMAREAALRLSTWALLRARVQVNALDFLAARFEVPVAESNAPRRWIVVENIEAGLRLLPDDEWALDHFHASFAGARLSLAGTITHASAVRDWPLFQGRAPGIRDRRGVQRLRDLADALERIRFATPPDLRLTLEGDARDLATFSAHLTLDAPDADTPWGRFAQGVFTARLHPATTNEFSLAELNLEAAAAKTQWAGVEHLEVTVTLVSRAGPTNLVEASLSARAAIVETEWAGATNVTFTASWLHSLTNAIPLSGRGEMRAVSATTRWAGGSNLWFAATLATPTKPPKAEPAWAWWTNLQPYHLDWEGRVAQLDTEKLDAENLTAAGHWQAPRLTVTNVHAAFPEGDFSGQAQLDVATREAAFGVRSDFDVRRLAPLVGEKGRRWLARYSLTEPPHLSGHGALILPPWTNVPPDWREDLLRSLRLAGEVAITNGAYLGAPADWAVTHVTFTNRVWHLPDFVAGRPEGTLRFEHLADDTTREFYFGGQSTVDPAAVRSLLGTNGQRGLDYFVFTAPPVVDGEVWGRWRDNESVGVRGRVALTNFTFRGETAGGFEAALRYTNRVLEVLDPRLARSTGFASADGITADFNAQRVYLTNGLSTTDPMVIARGIGPKTGRALEPYRFLSPPTVRVNGYAPLKGDRDAAMHFAVDGGPFEWFKFRVPQIAGNVYWLGDSLMLTNVEMRCYGGQAAGFADFDLDGGDGTDFGFTVGVTNVNLRALMADLSAHTNGLDGTLRGWLAITNANSRDRHSWNGHGSARLQDGLLWEFPIFGVLSKPLDGLVPGLGNSRFSDGEGRFSLTNGVIHSDSLEMRAATMRLQYDGTVDFDGSVNARVEAELLRDTWLVGPLLRLVFWPVTKFFEFKVTGTLGEPKAEPLYVLPRVILMPLHPIKSLEELFSTEAGRTNAPSAPKKP